jgi:putative YhdH/YhfP family quinone oxidoreductase
MRGFVLTANDDTVDFAVAELAAPHGDVVIEVDFSALNFKDELVAQAKSRVRRSDQLVMGVEAAGRVVKSNDQRLREGDEAVVFGGPVGVATDGGFAEYVGVSARYASKIPSSFVFHSRQAMIYGLAGYTAMASILALEDHGLATESGDVLVTGATGGVGSLAVVLLARRGYRVVASTGSSQHAGWLRELGASEIIGRDEIADRPDRVLGTERWAGAVDCVGGSTLPAILRSLKYGGAVAASGLVAGAQLDSTVYPFITRAVSLLGIDAVESSVPTRDRVWREICEQASGDDERLVERTLRLQEVPEGLEAIRSGSTRGRWLVDVKS